MRRQTRGILAMFLALGFTLPACSGSGSNGSASGASGSVTVFAAASLTDAFQDGEAALGPDLHVTYDFAGSGTLVEQVRQGAPADVIATADTASMQTLTDAGLVDDVTVFAHNRLQILVARGDPKGVRSLADLARTDLTVVLCDPSVPAGKYAQQILGQAGVTAAPRSLEPDVKSAVARVTSGEADATIVYVTDVRAAGDRAVGVTIPDDENVVADYPIAVVRSTEHRAAATAFVDAVRSGAIRDALRNRGFED